MKATFVEFDGEEHMSAAISALNRGIPFALRAPDSKRQTLADKKTAGDIRVGIGGWTYEPWRGGMFYPKGHAQARELEYASRKVTSIEINGTFYGSQKPRASSIGRRRRRTISSSR